MVVVEVMNVEEEERALYGIDTADTTAQQMEDSETMSYLHPTATSATTTSAVTAIAKFGNALPEHINLTLVDSIPVIGAMLDGVTTKQDSLFDTANAVTWDRNHHTEYRNEVQSTAASYIAERESRDGILLSSGLDEDGSLLRVYNGLHLSKLASRGLPGVSRVFTWSCIEYGLLLAIYENKTKVLLCTEHVILSSKERSELQFKEIPGLDSGFIDHSSTLNMGCIATIQNDSILVQIIPNGVRLVRMTTTSTNSGSGTYNGFGEPLQDVIVADSKELGGLGGEEGELVMAGDICMGYVTLHTTSQKLYVLKYNTMEESLELIHTITTPSGTSSSSMEVEGRDTGNLTESTVISASLYYGTFDAAYQANHYYNGTTTTSQSGTNKPHSSESSETSPELLLEQQQQLLLQQSKVAVEEEELTLYGEVLPNSENQDEHNTSNNAAECNGKKKINKVNNSRKTRSAHTNSTITTASTAANTTTPPLTDGDSTEQAYLILAELHGYISIIRLSTMLTVFRSRQFTTLSDTVTMHTNMTQQEQEEDIILEGLIIESKLVRLMDQMYPEDSDRSTLCLVFLLNTGDLVTYRGIESRGYTSAFHKIDQRPVVNKRAPDGTKLVRSFSAEGVVGCSTGNSSTTAVSDDIAATTTPAVVDDVYTILQAYLSGTEYTNRGGPSLSHLPSSQQARGGVLVAGNDAVIVTAVQGMPSVLPLGFPEVPFINYGQHCITPLQVGSVNAITVLWFEWDDLELIKNPTTTTTTTTSTAVAGVNKTTRAATFGIYQQINNIEIYPHSDVSIKRIPVGRTIHRFSEILNRTDDRTQQALLEKKTFVLACSVEKKQVFLPSVLTEEELQEDSELYERYYTSLESFCQPDENYGKPPLISSRLHTLALLQGTTVVDNYDLPINECITDTTVLYLNLEKYINFPGNLIPMKVNEKRVFIASCTTVIEKRGEDTQGNGRLLLFALDYALFERDEDEEHTNSTDTTEKNHYNSTLENGNTTTNATTSNTSSTTTATTTNGADKEQLSVAQAKFLGAIKPKLRLIWSGPGPASVVRQLGEYVLSTVSGTIYVYKFNTAAMELEQVSFYFTQVSYYCYYYCTVTVTDAIFMVCIYLFYSLYLLFIYI